MDDSKVYVLHFDRPYWLNCQHYVGYTSDLDERIRKHRAGNGSKLCRYAGSKGISFSIVHVESFPDRAKARAREMAIKKRGGGKLCPICKG